jgi:hypothetical protein
MHKDAVCTEASPLPVFPAGSDTRWKTEYRMVWNEREHTTEERELIYEISWIAELGVWRRFLCSQRTVQN